MPIFVALADIAFLMLCENLGEEMEGHPVPKLNQHRKLRAAEWISLTLESNADVRGKALPLLKMLRKQCNPD